MCTAVTYNCDGFYFGRTLDYDISWGEEICITPRRAKLDFKRVGLLTRHYAIIGMARVQSGYPLYFDAFNEHGLCVAALNFTKSAKYCKPSENGENIAHFELIPWLLGQCRSVDEAREVLSHTNITDDKFKDLPASKLHWLIADKNEAITLEAVSGGMRVHDNPVGVLTNEPPFEVQMLWLSSFMQLSSAAPINRFAGKLDLTPYSRGMGALGLPGDYSSASRFVRAAFTKLNSVCASGDLAAVNQFFHILGSVDQVRGCCRLEGGGLEITRYTSCADAERGVYYYTTYENHQINAVDMTREDLESDALITYPLCCKESINHQN